GCPWTVSRPGWRPRSPAGRGGSYSRAPSWRVGTGTRRGPIRVPTRSHTSPPEGVCCAPRTWAGSRQGSCGCWAGSTRSSTRLGAHPAVAASVVVGRRDPAWVQRVRAVVVPADAGAPPTLADLRSWVREPLPAYAAPRELDLRESIPLLASGKPDLVTLRET